MTDNTRHEALRLADWLQAAVQTYPQMSEDEPGGYASEVDQVMDEAAAELRRLHAENEALRTAHVQNPAEIEHVAGDVSKNGAEANASPARIIEGLRAAQSAIWWRRPTDSDQPEQAHWDSIDAAIAALRTQQPAPAGATLKPHGWLYDWTHSSATGKPDTTYTGFTKDEAHARKHDNCTAVFTTPQPAPAPLSEREMFEATWEKAHGKKPVLWETLFAQQKQEIPPHCVGRYFYRGEQAAWGAWQARAALAAQGGAA